MQTGQTLWNQTQRAGAKTVRCCRRAKLVLVGVDRGSIDARDVKVLRGGRACMFSVCADSPTARCMWCGAQTGDVMWTFHASQLQPTRHSFSTMAVDSDNRTLYIAVSEPRALVAVSIAVRGDVSLVIPHGA